MEQVGQQYEAGGGRRQPQGRSVTLLNSQEEEEGRVLGRGLSALWKNKSANLREGSEGKQNKMEKE